MRTSRTNSLILAALEPFHNRRNASLDLGAVRHNIVGLAPCRYPRDEHIEIEMTNALEARDVRVEGARGQKRGHPVAIIQIDRIAGEENAMLRALPQVCGRSMCMTGNWEHQKVVIDHVARCERAADTIRACGNRMVALVHEQRRIN